MKTIDEIVAEYRQIDVFTGVSGDAHEIATEQERRVTDWIRTTLTEQKTQIIQEAERRIDDMKPTSARHWTIAYRTARAQALAILKTLGEELSSKSMDE